MAKDNEGGMAPCTLLVRHLPSSLSDEDKKSLLLHFGASHVRVMGNKGRMKHAAFATFSSHDKAKQVLTTLHQMEILGKRLTVEFSKSQHSALHPKLGDEYGMQKQHKEGEGSKKEKVKVKTDPAVEEAKLASDINGFAPSLGLTYPINPRLRYMYPPPSMSILTNIANALASVPRFYVQVLHLMNKMHLPAPFGPITATPPLATEQAPPLPSNEPDDISARDMDVSSTEESEIESDSEATAKDATTSKPAPAPSKRKRKAPPVASGAAPKLKFQKIVDSLSVARVPGIAQRPEDVFDQPQSSVPKKNLEFKITAASLPTTIENLPSTSENEPKTKDSDITTPSQEVETRKSMAAIFREMVDKHLLLGSSNADDILEDILNVVEGSYQPGKCDSSSSDSGDKNVMPDVLSLLEKYHTSPPSTAQQVIDDLQTLLDGESRPSAKPAQESIEETGGFGKLEPVTREEKIESSDEEEEEVWGQGKFISSRRLRKGRISQSEMRQLNVYRKYDPGEPSARLYLKNLHARTSEQDLHYIYGRFVQWENEQEKNMFDIRLMKEGRMKGQAFITLASPDQAKQALNDTNGFELNGKPMVVQFARSAKPKEGDEKAKK